MVSNAVRPSSYLFRTVPDMSGTKRSGGAFQVAKATAVARMLRVCAAGSICCFKHIQALCHLAACAGAVSGAVAQVVRAHA